MDPLVENENDKQIKDTFSMNFNLESSAFNEAKADVYNLSRLQVSPYWSTNHLMMKIRQDSKQSVSFEIGDEKLAKKWTVTNGAAEFLENEMILTSAPSKEGHVILKDTLPKDYKMSFAFKGNIVGQQSVYVNYDKKSDSYMQVALVDNEIVISEKLPAAEVIEKERIPLDDIKWDEEEYAFNKATVYSYQDTQEGSRIDEEEYPRNLTKKRVFNIAVKQGKLSIEVDKEISKAIEINPEIQGKQVGFGAMYSIKNTEHEQYADDIYDTMVEDILITNMENETLFTNQYTKLDKVENKTKTWFDDVVDFFIETF